MATRVEPFEVSTPAGTAIASYLVTPLRFQSGRVDRVEILVPPGPSGLVGFKLAHSGQSVIPIKSSVWNIADNAKFDWPLTSFPEGDAWALWTYNLDVYPHSIFMWFHVFESEGPIVTQPVPIPIDPGGTAQHGDITALTGT